MARVSENISSLPLSGAAPQLTPTTGAHRVVANMLGVVVTPLNIAFQSSTRSGLKWAAQLPIQTAHLPSHAYHQMHHRHTLGLSALLILHSSLR
jgi:hypothetical protein